MKYMGMPMGMWALFGKSFEKHLIAELCFDADTAKSISIEAKLRYKQIVAGLPEFERGDRFKMNIVSCALLAAFVLSMPERPNVERLTEYYEARFTACGICTLMRELGLADLVPALCRLDYSMSEAGGTSEFVREYTLASGGAYCDCGYKKK